ncbi:MAG: AraC family transcriptional regulator [Bacteroidota bacterium]
MNVRIHKSDLMEASVDNYYPAHFRSDAEGGITERTLSASILGAEGTYQELYMENIHIGYGDFHMDNPMELTFESDMETVEMHFALFGDTLARDLATDQPYAFGYNQHNIIYASDFRGRSIFPPRQGIKIFEINLLPTFFTRFLPPGQKSFVAFLRSLERQESTLLSPHNFPITPSMHLIIQEILNCNRQGIFKRMFLEAKVIELLLLQLEQICALDRSKPSAITKQERERMYAVRRYLLDNFDHPSTLSQLAHRFGTNEYALKKGFKEVFGTTVFNFWNTAKMEQAQKLLREEGCTVSEVADQVGYKNPQHFTTAFKKRFGYPPSKLR